MSLNDILTSYMGATTGTSGWAPYQSDYKESFEKLITYVLGSNLPQTTKNEFMNAGMRLKEFRKYVTDYFPQYIDKITLWEKLHGE